MPWRIRSVSFPNLGIVTDMALTEKRVFKQSFRIGFNYRSIFPRILTTEVRASVSSIMVLEVKNSRGIQPISLNRIEQSSTSEVIWLATILTMYFQHRYLLERTWSLKDTSFTISQACRISGLVIHLRSPGQSWDSTFKQISDIWEWA